MKSFPLTHTENFTDTWLICLNPNDLQNTSKNHKTLVGIDQNSNMAFNTSSSSTSNLLTHRLQATAGCLKSWNNSLELLCYVPAFFWNTWIFWKAEMCVHHLDSCSHLSKTSHELTAPRTRLGTALTETKVFWWLPAKLGFFGGQTYTV